MLIYIDSGNPSEIREAMKLVKISGITTNPKISSISNAITLLNEFNLPTSIQIHTYDCLRLLPYDNKSLQIKVPITDLALGKRLIDEGFQVNFTLCMSLAHVIAASNVGAALVSFFIGRLAEKRYNVKEILDSAKEYLDNTSSKTQLLAASIRDRSHFELAAASKVDCVTIPPARLIEVLDLENPMSKSGLAEFLAYTNSNPK